LAHPWRSTLALVSGPVPDDTDDIGALWCGRPLSLGDEVNDHHVPKGLRDEMPALLAYY